MYSKLLKNYYIKNILILSLSLSLILFTQWIKALKYGDKGPQITKYTFVGLFLLGFFSILGITVQKIMQKCPVKFVRDFPILGWVSIVSLIFCLTSTTIIKTINAVDFLSITTPILTYAGVSIANKLEVLKNISWKIAITGIFVFLGTYLGSALLAEFGLFISK